MITVSIETIDPDLKYSLGIYKYYVIVRQGRQNEGQLETIKSKGTDHWWFARYIAWRCGHIYKNAKQGKLYEKTYL